MNFHVFILLSAALWGALTEALPQRVHLQKLPSYPLPTERPCPIRVRRALLGGQISIKDYGGGDAKIELTHGIGTPNHNVIGQVLAEGNVNKVPVAAGGTLAYNNKGFGVAIGKEHITGQRDTLTKNLSADLITNGGHKLSANVIKSDNTLSNGFKFKVKGHDLDYSNFNGQGASSTQSNIPNSGGLLQLGGKAKTRLDLTGPASKYTSNLLSGQKNFGGAFGLTYMFG